MAQPIPAADPPAPDEAAVRRVAREAYFWAWPRVELFARLQASGGHAPMRADAPGLLGGQSVLALDASPVVLQVPDFGARFWRIHVMDARTDGAAHLGCVYGSPPGFYLLAGPGWVGEIPAGIRRVFGVRTETVIVMPQLEAGAGAAQLLDQVDAYPVAAFDGRPRRGGGRWLDAASTGGPGDDPDRRARLPLDFRRLLPAALQAAPLLPGEHALHRRLTGALAAVRDSAALAQVFDAALEQAERELQAPLAALQRAGRALPHHWWTLEDSAADDDFMRALAARADPMRPPHGEVASFYLRCDVHGAPLDARRRYTLDFAAGKAPPVRAFWSLSAGAAQAIHAAGAPHAIVSRDLDAAAAHGGAFSVHLQAEAPAPGNAVHWLPLPTADGHALGLCLRCYWPGPELLDGRWAPPAVVPVADEPAQGG